MLIGGYKVTKTIQVRVDSSLKDSADSLFASLGFDTSTAIRMFLVAAMDAGGLPFPVTQNVDRDVAIRAALARRKAGSHFYTAEEFLAQMRATIEEASNDASEQI